MRADREAAGDVDAATVDQLLERATGLLDAARQALDGGDAQEAPRQMTAARATAMTAEALLRAQLSDYGLPSQQAGASRTLDTAYRQIKDSTERTADATDENVTFLVTTAQALYQQAYDLYNAGTYAQAAETARVGAALGHIAGMLSGDGFAFEQATFEGSVGMREGHAGAAEARAGESKAHEGVAGGEFHDAERGVVIEEAVPGTGAVIVEPWFFGGEVVPAIPSDFSTESPIAVPEPEF